MDRPAVTVVEVGPATVRGPAPVDDELAAGAIESIDDEVMLADDRPVAVADVWAQLLRAAAGDAGDRLVLVHPTWWSRRRVGVVAAAARDLCPTVATVSRADVLADGETGVVEIGADHVVTPAQTIVRTSDRAVVGAVLDDMSGYGAVLIDAPPRIDGAAALARTLVDALRAHGVTVSVCGPHAVRRAAARARDPAAPADKPAKTRRRRLPILAGAVLTTVSAAAAAVTPTADPPPPAGSVLLTEGGVTLLAPSGWPVERITGGTGSARLRIASPTDPGVALHLTQSRLPGPQSLDEVAAALRGALSGESAEVFTDFRPDDRRAGRAAVTYRERRAGHHTEWIVLAGTAVRMAIGCQSPPRHADLIRAACDEAVRSARTAAAEKSSVEGTG